MQNVSKAANSRFALTCMKSYTPIFRRRPSQIFRFSSTPAATRTSSTVTSDGSFVKTVTKKNFSKLPKVRGEKKALLPPWDGGLKSDVAKVDPSTSDNEDELSSLRSLASKRTRQKPKSMTKNAEAEVSKRTSTEIPAHGDIEVGSLSTGSSHTSLTI